MSINDDLLNDDPDSLAVEADESAVYDPETESNVVVTEPKIISVGRGVRKREMRELPPEQK